MKALKWQVLIGLVVGSLVLAACGAQQGATDTPEPTGPAEEETAPAAESPDAEATEEAAAPEDRQPIIMAVDGQITQLSNAASDVPTAEAAQRH